MDDERLKICNQIRSELSNLEMTRKAVQEKLTLSICNRILDDSEALAVAKESILKLYDKLIADKKQEFAEA